MDYSKVLNLVAALGWKHSGSWANREFYSLGKFTIVEHNNNWTIQKDDDLYYIDIENESMLMEYTAIVTRIMSDAENPDCTLREFREDLYRLNEFYKRYAGDEEMDFGFLE